MDTDYAFTYKINVCADCKLDVTKEMYDIILRHIVEKGGVIRFVYYELDKSNQWHIHGSASFFELPGQMPSYKMLSYQGFTSKWRKIYDFAGWEEYSKKSLAK